MELPTLSTSLGLATAGITPPGSQIVSPTTCSSLSSRDAFQNIATTLPDSSPPCCSECNLISPTHFDIETHNITRDGIYYVCDWIGCKSLFLNACKLRQHQQTEGHYEGSAPKRCPEQSVKKQDNSLACQLCRKQFQSTKLLREHMAVHKGKKKYQCRFCDARFSRRDKVRIHELRVTGHRFACKWCPKRYMFPTHLTMHYRTMHNIDQPKVSTNDVSSSPPPPPPPSNPDLQNAFQSAPQLLLSDPLATPRNIPRTSQLVQHTSQFVNPIKTFNFPELVPVLPKAYSSPKNVESQKIVNVSSGAELATGNVHNIESVSNISLEKNISKNKHPPRGSGPTLRYLCQFCPKRFVNFSELDRHTRKHTGEKPYTCPECGKKFAQQGNLLRHKATHSGTRPHLCPFCGHRFTDPSSLTRHKRIHYDFRPYVCKQCNAQFRNISNLKAHRVVKHGMVTAHRCPICNVYKITPSQLTKHLTTHDVNKLVMK
eukprot:898161_1